MNNAPVLSIKHLYCQCGQRYLLHDINWEVQPGENWVVFGANGSGKTTLLSIIAGFRSQTRGEITVLGEPLSRSGCLSSGSASAGSAVLFWIIATAERRCWMWSYPA